MSQYVNFYLKSSKNSPYICIGNYGRSSTTYEIARHYVPYEKTKVLTIDNLNDMIICSNNQMTKTDNTVQRYIEKINKLYTVSNFNDEILHMIESYEELIKEAKEEREWFVYTANYFEFLIGILGMNDDAIICAGIEAAAPDQEDNA